MALSGFVCFGWAGCRDVCRRAGCFASGADHNDCRACAVFTADGQCGGDAERAARYRERAGHISGDGFGILVLWRGIGVLGAGGGGGAVWGEACGEEVNLAFPYDHIWIVRGRFVPLADNLA